MTDKPNDAPELLPCPFCGGEARLIKESDHHGEFYELGCKDVSCLGHWAYYTESPLQTPILVAINKWNTRATPKPVAGADDRLREAEAVISSAIEGLTLVLEYGYIKDNAAWSKIDHIVAALRAWGEK